MGADAKQEACDIYISATELFVLKTCLEFALYNFFYPLIMESDYLEVVNIVNKKEYSFAAHSIIVSKIQDLVS